MKNSLIFQILLVFFLFDLGFSATEKYIQAEIKVDSPDKVMQIREMGLDIIRVENQFIEIVTDSVELAGLKEAGFETRIIQADMVGFYRSRIAADSKVLAVGYKSLAELIAGMDAVSNNYPGICAQKVSIGTTFEGRDIWAIKISDNPGIEEDEPEILFTALTHAREGLTPEILLNFMNYLGANYGIDADVTYLVDNRQIWIILVVNPDGYNWNDENEPGGGGMWRKNRSFNSGGARGVDLNRNFGYMWGYDNSGSSPNPSSETYRGTGPFSELETKAYRDFVTAHNFQIICNFHSYSNLFIWAWGYQRTYTPDEDIFAMIGDTVSGMNGYAPGPGWGLYLTNGDSDDWAYGEQTTKNKILSFTMETGTDVDGFWPSLSRMPVIIEENLQPCLYLTKVAGNQLLLRAPQRPVLHIPDTILTPAYNIAWSLHDTDNPAINYELTEMKNFRIITDSANSFTNWVNRNFVSSSYAHTPSSSFYSGSPSTMNRYFQTAEPYAVVANDTLKFWANYNITNGWDYAYVQVSTDKINFAPISGNLSTADDPYGNNNGYGITGWSNGWVQGLYNLGSFVGQEVYFRFSYTDHNTAYSSSGVYFDDISPIPYFDSSKIFSSTLTDTTYAITDQKIGTYYYKVRAKDVQGQWGDYSAIDKVINLVFICGDVDRSQKINLLDVSYIISFLYRGGPAPIPWQSADVDHSGKINLLDVSYIISHLYRGGPPPSCL
jgi:hypothetical protein